MPSPNARHPDPRFVTITGRWRTLGHVVAEPAFPVRGTDTYELVGGGHFLVHHVDVTVGDEPLQAIEVIGETTARGTSPAASTASTTTARSTSQAAVTSHRPPGQLTPRPPACGRPSRWPPTARRWPPTGSGPTTGSPGRTG
jgi:hypothetical protein